MPRLRPQTFPPEWWRPSLYDYASDEMPLEGWVWEFMRRQRLQLLLPQGCSVDAMNPDPDKSNIELINYGYFYPWPRAKNEFPHPPYKWPFSLSPSVTAPFGLFPKNFSTHYFKVYEYIKEFDETNGDYIIEQQFRRAFEPFNVDLSRSDGAIKRDFAKALKAVRSLYKPPKRSTPRVADWAGNFVLQVWDLVSLGVSIDLITLLRPLFGPTKIPEIASKQTALINKPWPDIYDHLSAWQAHPRRTDLIPEQSSKNALDTAQRLIDEGGWFEVVIQLDSLDVRKKRSRK